MTLADEVLLTIDEGYISDKVRMLRSHLILVAHGWRRKASNKNVYTHPSHPSQTLFLMPDRVGLKQAHGGDIHQYYTKKEFPHSELERELAA